MCWRADKGVRPYRACGLRHPRKGRHAGRPPQNAQGRRYLRRGRCLYRPATPVPPRGSQRQRKEKHLNAMTTPTISAPSATGRQLQTCRREKRARRQAKIGACTDPPTPVARRRERAGARLSGLFFWTVHGPFSFPQEGKENGGCIPLDQPPAGAEVPVAAGRRPVSP